MCEFVATIASALPTRQSTGIHISYQIDLLKTEGFSYR